MMSRLQHTIALLAIVAMAIQALAAPTEGTGNHSDQTSRRGTVQASARLMKELMETYKSDSYKKGLFQAELVNDNLYEWEVRLFFPDAEHGLLHKDLALLKEQGKRDYVLIRITFPQNYPNELPFVRAVYPRFRTHQTGALCMYLLSPQGWLPDCTVEGLIITIIDHLAAYRVDFSASPSEYSDPESDKVRKWFYEMHRWDKPRSDNQTWYEGPVDYN